MRRLLSLLLVLLPLPALAITINPPSGTAWDYYVIAGNVPVVSALMESVKAMTDPASNPAFRTLVATLATAGFAALTFVTLGGVGGSPARLGKYIIAIWLLTYMMFTVKINLAVTDETNTATTVVTDVPAAVGLPAAVIGEVGRWLTASVEQNFSLANYDNLKLSNGAAINLNAMALEALSEVKITAPWLRSSLTNYIYDCAIPRIYSGQISQMDVMTATNLWSVLAQAGQSQAVMTTWYNTSGSTQFGSCYDSFSYINAALVAYEPSMIASLNDKFGFLNSGVASSYIAGALQTAMEFSSAGAMSGVTAGQAAIQMGVVDAFRGTYQQAAMATGSNELMLALNMEQAKKSQKTGWYSTLELFKEAVPVMYAVLQAFIIGLAPIVMAISVVPKIGGSIIKGWFEVLVWLILWAPGFAIGNYLMAVREQGALRYILSDGITLMSDTAMNQAANDYIMQTGLMMTMVPLILWGLVKSGSIAMTSAMERSSGAPQAQQAAGAAAQGSFSGGNVSLDNMSANKHDLSHSRAYGQQPTTLHHGAGESNDVYHMSGHQLMKGGLLQGHDKTLGDEHSNKVAHANAVAAHTKASHSMSHGTGQAYQKALSHFDSASVQHAGVASAQHLSSEQRAANHMRAAESVHAALRDARVGEDQSTTFTAAGMLRAGGFSKEADEVAGAKNIAGAQSIIDKIGAKSLKSKGLEKLMDLAGLATRLEAGYTGRSTVSSGQSVNTGSTQREGAGLTTTVGQNSQRGSGHSDTYSHGKESKTGAELRDSREFLDLTAFAREWTTSKSTVDETASTLKAGNSYTFRGSVQPHEYAALRAQQRQRETDLGGRARDGSAAVREEANRELENKHKATLDGKPAVQNLGNTNVTKPATQTQAEAKAGEQQQGENARRPAASRTEVERGIAAQADASNNKLAEQMRQWMVEQNGMDNSRTLAMGTVGGVHGLAKGGPLAGLAGLAAGLVSSMGKEWLDQNNLAGVFSFDNLGNSSNVDGGKAVASELENKPADIVNADGRVIGRPVAFTLDHAGNADTIYLHSRKDEEGRARLAYGHYDENSGGFTLLSYTNGIEAARYGQVTGIGDGGTLITRPMSSTDTTRVDPSDAVAGRVVAVGTIRRD